MIGSSRLSPPRTLSLRALSLLATWSLLLPTAPARDIQAQQLPAAAAPQVQPAQAQNANPSAVVSVLPNSVPQAAAQPDRSSGPDSLTGKCLPPPNPDDVLSELRNPVDPRLLPPEQRRHPDKPGDEWGEITVAQPKIWQFDRVSSLLDGLLRDVEGVSLSDLTQLNPNAQNAAAVKFVQSALEVGVQYDQAAAVNAQNTQSTFQAQQGSQLQQLNAYNAYLQTLTTQRNSLATQLAAATNQVSSLQALQAAGTATPAQVAELAAAQTNVTNLSSSLSATNTLISGAGAPPALTAPPTLVGTSVTAPASGSSMSSSLNGFSQVLSSLPQGVQNNLSSALGSPTLPATKQLDNFITLLYERLAREVSVLQDDLTRDPESEAFLLQFDVGLYPSKRASDHVARVEFDLNCPGCKIYSLYPGMSAYNIASYSGSSKRTTLWGNVLTLFGFGLSASYRRQVDTLQGGLVQSVYTAGFQNGVLDTDRFYSPQDNPQDPGKSNSPQNKPHYAGKESAAYARQSFGWYYGQAPTEKLVTPGIRTTFAMLTVPRKLVEKYQDRFGNVNACLAFDINGAWARRDNPTLHHSYFSALDDAAKAVTVPGYLPLHHPFYTHNDENSYVYKRASVRLPVAADDVPLVARRDRQKLHVIRMEYNTVYAPPPAPSSAPPPTSSTVSTSSTSTSTPAPSTSTSTATTGTNTTTTTTTTTASAPAATPAPAPAPATPSYPNLNPLPCPKYECAAILIRLDRPVDPNLVVTVRGQPLERVRDWRGRATSILPAAQSGSDLTAAASASGSIFVKQLQAGRGLLESDQFEANSWFQLNARDILLNISKSVGTEDEFPTIQISEPEGTVLIPGDLQRSSTEIVTNGFHFVPQTAASIRQMVTRNYGTEDEDDAAAADALESSTKNPLWGGSYTPTTFLPLFAPDPQGKKFYARVGQTGEDILVGFLPDRIPPEHPSTGKPSFLETHTQVILEDRELDFAWSLYCYVQGEELACHLPRHEILRAYQSYLEACEDNSSRACPAIDEKYRALRLSFQSVVADLTNANIGVDRHKAWHVASGYSKPDELLPQSFVSTMQLWLEQFDADGPQNFFSPEPARIDFLPLSDDFWVPEAPPQGARKILEIPSTLGSIVYSRLDDQQGTFEPWHVMSATRENVRVEGCNYLAGQPASNLSYTLLGADFSSAPSQLSASIRPTCGYFELKTSDLAKDQIVFNLSFPAAGIYAGRSSNQRYVVMHLSTSRLKPSFGKPHVDPVFTSPTAPLGRSASGSASQVLVPTQWEIDIPASRVICADILDVPNDLAKAGFQWEWRRGDSIVSPPGEFTPDSDSYSLHLTIPLAALRFLPSKLQLLRDPGFRNPAIPVATLPDLRKLLLPSKLKIQTLSDSQFLLTGENAGIIDAVAVSNGETSKTFAATSGSEFALVTATIPAPAKTPAPADKPAAPKTPAPKPAPAPAKPAAPAGSTPPATPAQPPAQSSSRIDSPELPHVVLASYPEREGTAAPSQTPATTPPPASSPQDPAGTAKAPQQPAQKKPNDPAAPAKPEPAKVSPVKAPAPAPPPPKSPEKTNQPMKALDAGKYSVVPLVIVGQDPKTKSPIYMPLDVTDDNGGPLIFVVPAPTKATPDPKPNSTPTCTAPCALPVCAVAGCPPAPKPAT